MKNVIKTYPCGLRVVIRPMPNFKSVATSIFVSVGSRDELAGENGKGGEFGLSHFVEHMLFKGTKTRSSREIANTLSGLGVDYNAWTGTNATCYHTKGLNSNLETCCDILSDMYFNLKFKDDDFARECEVIVQEIAMRDDHPRMCLGELCAETFFAGTQYGHNIAGTVESVRAFKPEDIYKYMYKHYTAPKTIICFAGDITVKQADEMIKKYFLPNFDKKEKPVLRDLKDHILMPPQSFVTKQKDTEQQNVAVMFPVMNNNHDDKYAVTFLHEILSGDMSSRLFESVRDRLGLVYSIGGGMSLTHLGGYYYIYFSCTPKHTDMVLRTIASEVEHIKQDGVSEEEIQKVKNIKHADRLFESENVESSNQRNGSLLLEFNDIQPVEDYLENINAVNAAQVKAAAEKYLNYKNATVAIVGNKVKIKPFEILK